MYEYDVLECNKTCRSSNKDLAKYTPFQIQQYQSLPTIHPNAAKK